MNVTVVIATFGDARWAELANARALPSALLQRADAPDTEVLLEHSDSLCAARNAGARKAAGEWLCFLDADDELAAGYLAAMARAVEAKGYAGGRVADGCIGACLFVPAVQYVERGIPQRAQVLNDGRPLRDINRAVIGTLIHAALFHQVGGFANWPIYEDWDLWLRCERAGAELVDVPDAVYRAHRSGGSRNAVSGATARRYYDLIRRQYPPPRDAALGA